MDKFCVACKHYAQTEYGTEVCKHPSAMRPVNLVSGKRDATFCAVLRLDKEACGPKGKLWEAK